MRGVANFTCILLPCNQSVEAVEALRHFFRTWQYQRLKNDDLTKIIFLIIWAKQTGFKFLFIWQFGLVFAAETFPVAFYSGLGINVPVYSISRTTGYWILEDLKYWRILYVVYFYFSPHCKVFIAVSCCKIDEKTVRIQMVEITLFYILLFFSVFTSYSENNLCIFKTAACAECVW